MCSLLFTNASFDDELSFKGGSLHQHLFRHFVPLQLHFLSCILAQKETPLLAIRPNSQYYLHLQKQGLHPPPYALLEGEFPSSSLSSWGASAHLYAWAQEKNISYEIPSLDIVRMIHSKTFVCKHTQRLPGSRILSCIEELQDLWRTKQELFVLKTPLSSSGRGHLFMKKQEHLFQAQALLQKEGSLIAEPWMQRILDFSTQWWIPKQGTPTYLGATLCYNTERGMYKGSFAGEESFLFGPYLSHLEEHLRHAQLLVNLVQNLGFFGHLGLDAFIYICPQTRMHILQPIVEINARKTMGLVALQLYRRYANNSPCLSIQYHLHKEEQGLLPTSAHMQGSSPIKFTSQLILEHIFTDTAKNHYFPFAFNYTTR
ncbi:MAG: hypothetical protein FJZ58_05140 [Chlamydiae bacterium]|nr:hypothetical protein [Chlamydiota bacterium]